MSHPEFPKTAAALYKPLSYANGGVGSHGTLDGLLPKIVAVKVLHEDSALPQVVDRESGAENLQLIRAAQQASTNATNSTKIPAILNIEYVDRPTRGWFIMSIVRAFDLSACKKLPKFQFSPFLIFHIFAECIDTLQFLFSINDQGITVLNLAPANVMLKYDSDTTLPQVIVIDLDESLHNKTDPTIGVLRLMNRLTGDEELPEQWRARFTGEEWARVEELWRLGDSDWCNHFMDRMGIENLEKLAERYVSVARKASGVRDDEILAGINNVLKQKTDERDQKLKDAIIAGGMQVKEVAEDA